MHTDQTDPAVMMPDTTLSSSLNFGSSILSLPSDRGATATTPTTATPTSVPRSSSEITRSRGQYSLRAAAALPPNNWPEQERAQHYVSLMLTSIGRLQHLVDPKTLNSRLLKTYRVDMPDVCVEALWYVELLLVFAIGQLLEGQSTAVLGRQPGCAYFQEAMDLLPNLYTLREAGTLGIEILALVTFFLQCSNQKEDAYVHV